jgi:Protein of unknown function (DUF2975)
MKTRTEDVLTGMKILAYLAMIGYSIQCGSQIISFGVSFFNPESAKDIYKTSMNLYELRQVNVKPFIYVMSLIIALSGMHAHVWYLVIKLLSSLNLKNPFSMEVAKLLEKVGIQLIGIWIVTLIGEQVINGISKATGVEVGEFHPVSEYLVIAGIVYIISQVFKRGVEIQKENELTV